MHRGGHWSTLYIDIKHGNIWMLKWQHDRHESEHSKVVLQKLPESNRPSSGIIPRCQIYMAGCPSNGRLRFEIKPDYLPLKRANMKIGMRIGSSQQGAKPIKWIHLRVANGGSEVLFEWITSNIGPLFTKRLDVRCREAAKPRDRIL